MNNQGLLIAILSIVLSVSLVGNVLDHVCVVDNNQKALCLIKIPGEPNCWAVDTISSSAIHWSPVPGDIIRSLLTNEEAVIVEKIRPNSGSGADVDVALLRFEPPISAPAVEAWWGWPNGMKEGEPKLVTAVWQELEIPGTPIRTFDEFGVWQPGANNWLSSFVFPYEGPAGYPLNIPDSGFPVFHDGKFLGPVTIAWLSNPIMGTNPLAWAFELHPDKFPDFAPPRICVEPVGSGEIKVFWTLPDNGWSLESTQDLVNWQPVNTPVEMDENYRFVILPKSGSTFFRLQK
jgi:hypothetical protein